LKKWPKKTIHKKSIKNLTMHGKIDIIMWKWNKKDLFLLFFTLPLILLHSFDDSLSPNQCLFFVHFYVPTHCAKAVHRMMMKFTLVLKKELLSFCSTQRLLWFKKKIFIVTWKLTRCSQSHSSFLLFKLTWLDLPYTRFGNEIKRRYNLENGYFI